MSDPYRSYARTIPADRADMSVDAGLRSFMLGVYNKVGLGLVLSGALAWATASVAPVRDLMFRTAETANGVALTGVTPLYYIVAFAPLVLLLFGAFRAPSPRSANVTYWAIVAMLGASMGTLFFRYTGGSLASTFFVTAAAFGALSLFGYSTKKDLTGWGSFLLVGLVGLILASIVAIFFANPALIFAINAIGVLLFAGLIAYDTQRLKMTYYELGGDQAAMSVATSYGALSLYLDFINLFRFLLYFMGGSRD